MENKDSKIRNFVIIAHIDHGKSTLADRFLEITNTISDRDMKEQILDQMDIERERGITIKLQPVRMAYDNYELNLIDTPGHVDFTYEVSRSLMAVEGAVLLVDAVQGVQAQTLANLYLALDQGLEIIPVINKIDLPNAQVKKAEQELVDLLGCKKQEILQVSAKTGEGVAKVLKAVVEQVPPPKKFSPLSASQRKGEEQSGKRMETEGNLRALIFDSVYDEYKGVVAYVRIFSGEVKRGDKIEFLGTEKLANVIEVGYFSPEYKKSDKLSDGDIGYMVTDLKQVDQCRVGDTIGLADSKIKPLPGYKEVKPMVYAGIFAKEGSEYSRLREAIEKLKLNDAALEYQLENSPALGFGFRCGFLGLLHLEIFQERLKREFNLDLIVTTPSVAFKIYYKNGKNEMIYNPAEFPDPTLIEKVEEPIMKLDVYAPGEYMGNIMQLVTDKRGIYLNTEYLDKETAILHYYIPLTQLIVDFYDKLKSVSSGYASMSYDFYAYQSAEVVKVDILVAEEPVEALAVIAYRDNAHKIGKKIVRTLRDELPRQQFVVKLQAAIGGKIVAGERLSALRKDVTAKLYGGDYSRRQKLLTKQKKGKKKMMALGKVDIPSEVFLKVLKK